MSQRTVLSEKRLNHLNSGKKRKLNIPNHKTEIAKRNRNSGLAYTGSNGVYHDAKTPPDLAKVCGNSCQLDGCQLHLQKRVDLFNQFYEMANFDHQTGFLIGLIGRSEPSRRTAGNSVVRTSTFKYNLLNIGIKVPVCQKTFLDTFRIGKNRVRTIHDKLKTENYNSLDRRGTHLNRPKRFEQSVIQKINEHIDSFPFRISHYSREAGDPNRKYLNEDLNLSRMFQLFLERYPHDDRLKTVKWAYTREFHNKNLRFGQPRSDTCKVCDKLYVRLSSAVTRATRRSIEAETLAHHLEAETGFSKIDEDIQNFGFLEDTVVLCVDLEQVLFCPTLTHADVFYQRQLGSYNFCIWNARTDIAKMCFWNKTEGKRGATELCSCLLKYIKDNFNVLPSGQVRKLIVWSDRCVGQNNNFLTLGLYKYVMHLGYFTEIVQKFMVTGHSFLPCDRHFGLIEKKKRVSMVYAPDEWLNLITSARSSNPFQIQRMNRADFLDLDPLLELIPRPPTLKVTEIAVAKMTLEQPDKIYTSANRQCHQWEAHNLYCPYSLGIQYLDRAAWTPDWLERLAFEPKYKDPIPISEAKKNDLIAMLPYLQPRYHAFYNNLTTC